MNLTIFVIYNNNNNKFSTTFIIKDIFVEAFIFCHA